MVCFNVEHNNANYGLRVIVIIIIFLGWAISAKASFKIEPNMNRQSEQLNITKKNILPTTPNIKQRQEIKTQVAKNKSDNDPQEVPCFVINDIELDGSADFPSRLALQSITEQVKGHCLGHAGITLLIKKLQNHIIGQGYITSRVFAPRQNISNGKLRLRLVPGRIGERRLTDNSNTYVQLANIFPDSIGEILNLRDIEHGLENLKRLPTAQVKIEIVPGKKPGESDIIIQREQLRHWRLGANINDSGNQLIGRYQGRVMFSLDNPLSLSDLFYVSFNRDLDRNYNKGINSSLFHYSVPYGNWFFGTTLNQYNDYLTLPNRLSKLKYHKKQKSVDIQLSRLLYRSNKHKTFINTGLTIRKSHNYLNDIEIEIQKRRTTAWRIGLYHHRYFNLAVFNGDITYQQGTRWFGAQPAPEDASGTATALAKIVRLSGSLLVPFKILNQQINYKVAFKQQYSNSGLMLQDKFSIGGRSSVRGFGDTYALIAANGWYVNNELSWLEPRTRQQFYLGLDYGEVNDKNNQFFLSKRLAGAVTGIRGAYKQFSYDVFAGTPLIKPAGFKADSLILGFNLNWQY